MALDLPIQLLKFPKVASSTERVVDEGNGEALEQISSRFAQRTFNFPPKVPA